MEKEKNNMHINFAKVENQLKYRQFHLYFIRFLLFKYFFDKEFIILNFYFVSWRDLEWKIRVHRCFYFVIRFRTE